MPEPSFNAVLGFMDKNQLQLLLCELEKDMIYTTARSVSELGHEYISRSLAIIEGIKKVKDKLDSLSYTSTSG